MLGRGERLARGLAASNKPEPLAGIAAIGASPPPSRGRGGPARREAGPAGRRRFDATHLARGRSARGAAGRFARRRDRTLPVRQESDRSGGGARGQSVNGSSADRKRPARASPTNAR